MKYFLLAFLIIYSGCPSRSSSVEGERVKIEKTKTKSTSICKVDDQCQGFLRCINSKCETPQAITGKKTATTPNAIFALSPEKKIEINLELAVTLPQMTRGLMHRKTMKDDWGMLFIYDDVRVRSFWMKNTLLPLDMLFIDEKGKIVGIIEGAEPMTLTSRSVGIPAKYVLELNAGQAKKLGLQPGVKMKLQHVEAWQDTE